jgi:hypothetical protein
MSVCERCLMEFVQQRNTQIYCSVRCRDAMYKYRRRRRSPGYDKDLKRREYKKNKTRYSAANKAYRERNPFSRKNEKQSSREVKQKSIKKQVNQLSDSYIKRLLSAHGSPIRKNQWPKELVSLKRLDIQAQRYNRPKTKNI